MGVVVANIHSWCTYSLYNRVYITFFYLGKLQKHLHRQVQVEHPKWGMCNGIIWNNFINPSELSSERWRSTRRLASCLYYRTRIKFHGVQMFVVFVAYFFPTKINPPQLIFLPILPHRCIQRVIKLSVDIDHDIKIDVSSLLLGDHKAHHAQK